MSKPHNIQPNGFRIPLKPITYQRWDYIKPLQYHQFLRKIFGRIFNFTAFWNGFATAIASVFAVSDKKSCGPIDVTSQNIVYCPVVWTSRLFFFNHESNSYYCKLLVQKQKLQSSKCKSIDVYVFEIENVFLMKK